MELEIKNVSHTYKNGKKALSEISTSLTPGVYGLFRTKRRREINADEHHY